MNYVFLLFSLTSLLLSSSLSRQLSIQGKDISDYTRGYLKAFTPNDGLPQGCITALATDSSGRLWIGTQDGAAYYDGRKWTTVNLPNRTTSNYVQTMFVASDGAIWLSANRGQVHRYAAGTWQSFDTSEGLASTIVRSIQETRDETGAPVMWFGTSRGISRYSMGKWQTFTTQNSGLVSDYVYDIRPTTDSALWIATNHGVSRYTNGDFQRVVLPEGLRDTAIYSIMQTKDGSLWFGGSGIAGRLANKNWTLFHLNSSKTTNRVNAMCESSSGDIWFGAESCIKEIPKGDLSSRGNSLRDFVVGTTFENQMGSIFSIHETRGGVMWFGSLLGLYRYIPGKWEALDERTGLTNTAINYIYETRRGTFLFGTPRGLFQYSNGTWKLFDDKSGLVNNFVKAILEANDGSLWIGTLGGGVQRYANGTWKHFGAHDGLAEDRVYSMIQSRDGALWFATARGASKYLHGRWSTFTTTDGLAENQVMSLYQSSDGAIWFGTRSGLTRLLHGQWKSFTSVDGLAGNVVHSINGTSDGALWFGTFSSGISRFNPITHEWRTLNDTSLPALPNNVVYQVEEDRQRRLYFLTNKGVTRIAEQLQSSSVEVKNRVELFSIEDGLPSNEGMVRSSIVDSRGRIWVGTTKGAAYLNPAEEVIDTLGKQLLIERISIQKRPNNGPLKSGIELGHNENNISFEYTLLSFFKESETRYQTQLDPHDAGPSEWNADYKKEYTNLSDGRYVFRVWGRDYAGNISGPEEFVFVIHPPFWKTWWFRLLVTMALAGSAVGIGRLYTAQKLRRQLAKLEHAQLLEHERLRISQDMHDTVGSSLTRIAVLSDRLRFELEHEADLRKYIDGARARINSIGETAREVIDTMNEIVWSLSPRHDTLESLVSYMRGYLAILESTSMRVSINFQETVPNDPLTPDVRRNIFLIFKEAVNNLVKHSRAAAVWIVVSVADQKLTFSVRDDGIGFPEPSPDAVTRRGFGLGNMRERASNLGATLEIHSVQGKGTLVTFAYAFQQEPPK